METKTRIYAVSEITRNIKFILENQLPELWIEGEISNLRTSPSGHTYFTLKDELCQISAVLFKSQRNILPLKDGLHIFVFGKITVYEKGGNYQIIVNKWESKGLGALQLAFEELKNRLYKEGLFDEKHKKPLPLFPKVIGIVTSPTGAAIRDIINVIERRFSNINILLYPVRVQGEGAAEEIAEAIDTINQFPDIDVLIVGRGGGSLEDLWEFNEEIVARSIFRSRIPVISAVGHEIDYTISDFAADVRAPTPSAAAEIVIAKKSEFTDRIDFLRHRLQALINSYINELKARLAGLVTSYVFKEPENTLRQYSQRLDDLSHRLSLKIGHLHEIHCHRLTSLESRLNSLNPSAILNRGYSITISTKTGKIVTQPTGLKRGDELETQVAKGRFTSLFKEKVDRNPKQN